MVAKAEIDQDDCIILSIKLKSGRFEGTIQVPLYATDKERESFVDQWLRMMESGLQVGAAHKERQEKKHGI